MLNKNVPENVRSHRGFTLIEMAVVLVIAGLIIGTVIGALNVQVTGQRIKQTQERQEIIKSALINYVARNSHLPCPARISDTDSAAGAGVANCANSITVAGPVAYVGAVPWTDLGLLPEAVKDAYGRRFTYVVSAAAVGLNQDSIVGLTGNFAIYPSAADVTANTNQLNACTAPLTVCEKLAVVMLISHGANGYGGYSGAGNQLSDTDASDDEKANSDNANLTFILRDYNQQAFDDIVMWLKPIDILTSLNASGAIKDYRAYNNQKFERVLIAVASSAAKTADGCGVGTYSYDLAALPTTSETDAWGQTITIEAKVDSTPTALPMTFLHQFCSGGDGILTLRSSGVDVAQTSDDQDFPVSESEFVRYAIKFH